MTGTKTSFRSAALTQTCRPWNGKGPIEQMGYSIRTPDYRYTRWIHHESQGVMAEEIYDLRSDLYQRTNQIENPTFKNIIDEHRQLLEKARGK